MKNEDIQVGRTCVLELDPESSSAIEFGKEVLGKVLNRGVIDADKGTLNEMYRTQNKLPVIVVEDVAGLKLNVPERDVLVMRCRDKGLCEDED